MQIRQPTPARNRRRCRPGTVFAASVTATVIAVTGLAVAPAAYAEDVSTLSAFEAVDQFIGTGHNTENNARGNDHYGNTYPGATLPFGMVQSSPTTYETDNQEQFGGYKYSADQVRGFGMTRLSGTGCRPNYGGYDFPVTPFTGELAASNLLPSNPATSISDYFLDFSHENETTEPGYYSVDLDAGVNVELTATTRTAVSKYSFDENATLLFDAAGSNNSVSSSDISFDATTGVLTGSVQANIVCNGGTQYKAHFSATFDEPVLSHGVWDAAGVRASESAAQATTKHGAGAWLTFADGADVTATVGLSYVSVDGAQANADAEAAGQTFDSVRAQSRDVWEEALGTIDATGGTDRDRRTFYTSLYHALLNPNTFQDVDGKYIGFDNKEHAVEAGRNFYVNFSGWDGYRGQSQLVAMLYPKVGSDINQSIVDMVDQSGKWTSWPTYNQIQTKMSGDSLQNIVAAADDFGSTDYDRATALKTMVESQSLPATTSSRSDGALASALGWVPGDKGGAATSRTLEYATNDFAISQLAERLGNGEAFKLFSQRSQNWRNIFNFGTEHIDARDRNGFRNSAMNSQGDQFEQSTGKQYGFNVSHNMASLIVARGGAEKATAELDALLTDLDGGAFSETAYLANQPSFGLPWVYNWLQAPHKATDTLYRAADELFTTDPDGLAGNDDLGSLSGWYVWANLGLMPAIWGTADLLVTAPMFEEITISSIGSDRVIQINAPGAGDTRKYTIGLSVNGAPQTASWLPSEFSQEGGVLDFTMDSAAGTWGTGAGDVPPSYNTGVDGRNSYGITDDGAVQMGSLDAGGVTLSRNELAAAGISGGSKLPMGETGVEFTWPDQGPGVADHWIPHGQVVEFGDTKASGISFLGTATNGPSRGTAVVNYTDGTTKNVDVRFTDWTSGSIEPGNVRVVGMSKRNTFTGGSDTGKPTVYGTAVVPLDPTKSVASVTLPTDVNKGIMHVFDIALRPVTTTEEPGTTLPTRPEAQAPTAPTIREPIDIDGTVVVGADTQWSFYDQPADPATSLSAKTGWTLPDFDDSQWKTGKTSFGAKNGSIVDLGGSYKPVNLVQQYKPGTTNNIETFFFRSDFEISEEDLKSVAGLSGEVAYDDAARVYINGKLVAGFQDSRIEENEAGNMVYAGGNGSAPETGTFTVAREDLRAGSNTLAIQVHNTNESSSDVYMELKSLSITAQDSAAAISDVLLNVGTDETARNLAFYTDRKIAAKVQLAEAATRTGVEFPAAGSKVVSASSEETHDGRFSNKAVLQNLKENTSYIYRVGNDDVGWSRSYELWTGTFDDEYSFVYLTDAQIGASGSWEGDRDRWAAALDTIAGQEPDASMIVSGGDQVESHRAENEYASLIAPELMKQLPFAPTVGNHDNQSTAYNTHFFTPNRSETHGYENADRAGGDYWFNYNGVLYLNLNTNSRSEGESDHIEFMKKVIAEQGDKANWIVAVWHHSIYSAAFHSVQNDIIERRAALAPAMSELGVDLVLSGHDHIYTRSYLMEGTTPAGDRAAQEESGVTLAPEEGQVLYVTGNSASGSKFYGLDANSPDAAVKNQSNQPQYTDVDVSPTAITLTTYQTYDQKVIDKVTLTQAANDKVAPEISGPQMSTLPKANPSKPLSESLPVTMLTET